jgi:hypothetical protein
MEGLRNAIPYYKANSARFYNFGLKSRYALPVDSTYDTCTYGALPCWEYPDDHTIATSPDGGSSALPFSFGAWGDGCGNVHFPPNATNHYAYAELSAVRSTCENYGKHNGPDGKDLQTTYSRNLANVHESRYGDCGGGWEIYMRQSMPGFRNGGTGDDGKPMKSWWPFLYY